MFLLTIHFNIFTLFFMSSCMLSSARPVFSDIFFRIMLFLETVKLSDLGSQEKSSFVSKDFVFFSRPVISVTLEILLLYRLSCLMRLMNITMSRLCRRLEGRLMGGVVRRSTSFWKLSACRVDIPGWPTAICWNRT